MSEDDLMLNIVDPFTILYGSLMHEIHIADLTAPRRNLLKETYSECTFKPNANVNQVNKKLASRKYEKDLMTNASDILKLEKRQ